jgi:phosphatidate cytidylyltransferase
MLYRRVASALVLIPLVALLVYVGGAAFAVAIALVGLLAGYEYLALLRRMRLHPCLPLALLYLLAALADGQWPELGILRWSTWLAVAALLSDQVFRRNRAGSLASWATAFAGAAYIGLGLSYFIRLRSLEQGMMWVALVLVGTWVSDSGAYFVGVARGKRRLAPEISPKKSWEGVWGGLVSGVVAVWAMGWLLLGLAHWKGLALGVVLVVAATLGDLAESVIKRQVGVKDSGALIPGHGGMLDRVDSLLFVAPAIYYGWMVLSALL